MANWDEAISQVRSTNEIAFADYVEENWEAFARNVYHEDESGTPIIAHDPAISESVKQGNVVVDLWPLFDALADIPLLVIRGAISDILASDCVDDMRRRRSDLHAVEVAKRGHAPMLDEPEALAGVRSFLDSVTSA